jgi:hypothetical protein
LKSAELRPADFVIPLRRGDGKHFLASDAQFVANTIQFPMKTLIPLALRLVVVAGRFVPALAKYQQDAVAQADKVARNLDALLSK